jgi:ATP-binding cassette subfamily B protein
MSRSDSLPEALRLLMAAMDRSVAQRLALTLALVAAGGLLAGAAPLALKHLVDALSMPSTERATADSVLAFGALYLFALCGSRLVIEIRPLVANTAEQRIHARLRQRFFSHLLSLRLSVPLHRPRNATGWRAARLMQKS